MDEKTYTVPYGKGEISFDLPSGMRGHLVVSKPVPPIEDVPAAIAESLAQPEFIMNKACAPGETEPDLLTRYGSEKSSAVDRLALHAAVDPTSRDRNPPGVANLMTKRIHIPRDGLDYFYNVLGWTQAQIATHYDCGETTVYRLMKAYGLAARCQADYVRIDISCTELRELYLVQGQTADQIAARKGCGQTTVLRNLHDCGIPLRPPGSRLAVHVPPEVLVAWPTPTLAYAVGQFAADGNMEKGSNTVSFPSTDLEMVENFCACLQLGPEVKIHKYRQKENYKLCYRVSFADRAFRAFLEELGLAPKKSKTLRPLAIPDEVFSDFARGDWDGDGGFCLNLDGNHMYLRSYLSSSSPGYLRWMQAQIERLAGLRGGISGMQLYYNGDDAISLGYWLYYAPELPALSRKRAVWERFALPAGTGC